MQMLCPNLFCFQFPLGHCSSALVQFDFLAEKLDSIQFLKLPQF